MLSRIARRWVAGTELDGALGTAKELNRAGLHALIDNLGEHYHAQARVRQAVAEYQAVIAAIRKERLQADLTIKPTQLGVLLGRQQFQANLGTLAAAAKNANVRVWVDMEAHDYLEPTLSAVLSLRPKFTNLAIAIQAMLRSSEMQLVSCLRQRLAVRLVKGAYAERPEMAYQERREIDANYAKLMATLFRSKVYFAIATHDERLIAKAKELANGNGNFEFQLLYGMKNQLQRRLAAEGYQVSIYLPYGRDWQTYVKRRMRQARDTLRLHHFLFNGG
ncbi:MAG: proline dehydrogenase family protein [Candidatus Aenigmarchaeota archaeon]|nr:proline dehydrogenase family protein [Candidatus Aenigmarchaeota archaeon]